MLQVNTGCADYHLEDSSGNFQYDRAATCRAECNGVPFLTSAGTSARILGVN